MAFEWYVCNAGPYRCNGSKQIILANENAGLPAPVNVYDYEDSRAKRDCCHLSRLEARSIPRNYIRLTTGKISWDNSGLILSFVIENYTETINIELARNSRPQKNSSLRFSSMIYSNSK